MAVPDIRYGSNARPLWQYRTAAMAVPGIRYGSTGHRTCSAPPVSFPSVRSESCKRTKASSEPDIAQQSEERKQP